MVEYTSEVKICFGGNNHEAKSKEEYIKKVKVQFMEEFGIELTDSEITDIKRRES